MSLASGTYMYNYVDHVSCTEHAFLLAVLCKHRICVCMHMHVCVL